MITNGRRVSLAECEWRSNARKTSTVPTIRSAVPPISAGRIPRTPVTLPRRGSGVIPDRSRMPPHRAVPLLWRSLYAELAVARRRLTVVAPLLAFIASVACAGAVTSEPVLGKWKLTGQYAIGWGTAHPRVIYNGGVPSGKAWHLHWTNWGRQATTAHGLTWLYRPNGGYYARPGAIELRAYRLARCTTGGRPAYTRLSARVATRPGGPLGHWFAWGGWRTLCRFPS